MDNQEQTMRQEIKDLAHVSRPVPSTIDTIFSKLAPWLILVAGLLLILLMAQLGKTNIKVNETAAYTRVSNCIVAKSANPEFTQDEIERCYIQVEKNTGISLERFDEQTHGEN